MVNIITVMVNIITVMANIITVMANIITVMVNITCAFSVWTAVFHNPLQSGTLDFFQRHMHT
jgi:hypothetical protein